MARFLRLRRSGAADSAVWAPFPVDHRPGGRLRNSKRSAKSCGLTLFSIPSGIIEAGQALISAMSRRSTVVGNPDRGRGDLEETIFTCVYLFFY